MLFKVCDGSARPDTVPTLIFMESLIFLENFILICPPLGRILLKNVEKIVSLVSHWLNFYQNLPGFVEVDDPFGLAN